MNKEKIEATMTFEPEAFKYIEDICKKNNLTQTEFLKRSMVLMAIALNNKNIGNYIAIVDKKNDKIEEITGL